jgi:hypothetical protein
VQKDLSGWPFGLLLRRQSQVGFDSVFLVSFFSCLLGSFFASSDLRVLAMPRPRVHLWNLAEASSFLSL